ncbi:NAD(P)/FAD-dependent oxidoreductase [Nocardia puris]|uniref:NAD(P)/FAD-dependent oxidoreductase n=1 Tax=Nocardia puris TaxID=208602 RepID=UPI001895CDE0|nr:NAD(P)/FAD-dependent oxidoreductase [Nocardia puris]MBF6364410.1 NAD(P)/FAD-dependent oxidoreductase [Nocardia puris]MBF6459339.1 NAD(P)/FAD-dependent oxidoreductase [Nocardia puris]
MTEKLNSSYEVVVVGGGPAGLNGALMLARSRRSVVVIDAGAPRNAPADRVHGLLGRENTPPGELLARGREEVRSYGGQVVSGEVVDARPDGDGFVVTLADGRTTRARRLLVTTGLVDELPDITGLRERWGRDVLHCPYCHGWEVRDRAIGVLGTGPMSVHQVLMFRQLSPEVTFFRNGLEISSEDEIRLRARDITVVNREVTGLDVADDHLTGVRLADGTSVALDALAVGTRMVARSGLLDRLGLRPEQHPMGEFYPSEPTGRTSVPGVWLAGNVTDLSAFVGGAASAGAFTGAQINADLIAEETERTVARYRAEELTPATD